MINYDIYFEVKDEYSYQNTEKLINKRKEEKGLISTNIAARKEIGI